MKKTGIVLLAGLLLALAACGGPAGANESGYEELVVVGFSQVGAESDWRTANTLSMQAALSEANGFMLIFDDAQQKQERQITAIRNFIQQEVDYIVLAPTTETGWDTVLQEAKTAGIPVIIVDRMIETENESLFTCWVGSDFRKEADLAVAWLEKEFAGEPVKILHLQGSIGSTAQIGRTAGLDAGIRANENWSLVARAGGEFTQAKGQEVMEDFLHRDLMHHLFLGGADTGRLLERAGQLEIELVHPFYQVALFHIDTGDGADRESLRQRMAALLQAGGAGLYYFAGADQLAVLACAKTPEALNEQLYRTVHIVRHEMNGGGTLVTTLIGNVVNRLSAVKDAYDAADATLKKIRASCAGKVIDSNDTAQVAADIAGFSSTFSANFQQRLAYAGEEDLPALLQAFRAEAGGSQWDSMLYRYYTLIDILKTAVQVVAAARPGADQKDIAAQFSGAYDIFLASNQRDTFEEMAEAMLREALRMKGESQGFPRQGHVVSKAEDYIKQNYCDPNISLISVARHVGLSPAHFSTVFSQTAGKPFISYLTALRIEKAKQLLAQTDKKLAAIATEIGYNEPNYFSHVFKKSEDITPKEFRNKARLGGMPPDENHL